LERPVLSKLKAYSTKHGEEHSIYFWRDSTGNEIDVIIDEGDSLIPIELKAGETVTSDFFKGIRFWKKLTVDIDQRAALV
jgi:predicted AAA+ superfamily ATPase